MKLLVKRTHLTTSTEKYHLVYAPTGRQRTANQVMIRETDNMTESGVVLEHGGRKGGTREQTLNSNTVIEITNTRIVT